MKLGLGTWTFGGEIEPNQSNDDKKDLKVIQYAISRGITHIDTAEGYANGKTEELIGEAIKAFKREEIFIASKVGSLKLGYESLIKSCEESLKRLQTTYLDLFYIHRPNHKILYQETARGLNELLDKKLICHVGICNASVETIKAYQKYLNIPFFAVQNKYNLITRESVTNGVVDYCKKNGIHFIAWRPIQPLSQKGIYPLLDQVAKKYNKTNAQIAVRWLTQQENISILFKSSNLKHIEEVLDTEEFSLDEQDFKDLEKNFLLQKECNFIKLEESSIE